MPLEQSLCIVLYGEHDQHKNPPTPLGVMVCEVFPSPFPLHDGRCNDDHPDRLDSERGGGMCPNIQA